MAVCDSKLFLTRCCFSRRWYQTQPPSAGMGNLQALQGFYLMIQFPAQLQLKKIAAQTTFLAGPHSTEHQDLQLRGGVNLVRVSRVLKTTKICECWSFFNLYYNIINKNYGFYLAFSHLASQSYEALLLQAQLKTLHIWKSTSWQRLKIKVNTRNLSINRMTLAMAIVFSVWLSIIEECIGCVIEIENDSHYYF